MDTIKHALVLTGEVQPGFSANDVWPALAAYFRMEPERLRNELLARVPIAIKESDDLAKLQNLQSGALAVGAVTELHAIGSEGSLFVLVDNTPRGPVPHSYVEDRVRSGVWPSTINIAAVGSATWRQFIAPAAPVRASVPADQQATVAFTAMAADQGFATRPVSDLRAASAASAPAASYVADTTAATGADGTLPEGAAIHAGFWRRVAAYTIDTILVGIAMLVLFGVLGLAGATMASENPGIAFGMMGLGYVIAIVMTWLYFAKLESSPSQATIGKRVMGLKVTDGAGAPISFGRASGRFFGKIVTGLIPFGIGYMLAGWTGRKQALHDMMATTFVVFREVEAGRPWPTVRPPMPWYGWVLNTLPFVLTAIGLASYTWLVATMLGQAQTDLSDVSGAMEESGVAQEWSNMASTGDADAEKALVLAGLTAIFDEVEAAKNEAAQAFVANSQCMSEQRPSNNAWIESIQFGGFPPQCTVQVQLSSSSDIPFAARIERIEWTSDGSGNWACSSSMDSSYLPWPCQ